MEKTDNEIVRATFEERNLISVFMLGEPGIYSTRITWNDLMPVVEKIAKYTLEKECKSKKQFSQLIKHWNAITVGLVRPDIKITYEQTVNFIRWYNSQEVR